MPKVADFIENNREQLVERFVQEAGKFESSKGLERHVLIDTLPEYLAMLATISRQGHRGDPEKTKKRLEETHIGLRLRHGYSQEEVTSEYVLLGRLISSLWEHLPREARPTPEDTGLLLEELQDAMNQVVATFSGYTLEDRQAEKRTLRRLHSLAPQSLVRGGDLASLKQQLAPLVQVIQDALQADGAELLLADASGTQLEFVVATGACPAPPAGYVVPLDAPSFVARAVAADEPVFLADALTTSEGVLDGVYPGGLRSLLALRLWPHGKLLGVLTVGVKEIRTFEPRVRRYFEMLVDYLSGLLDRALLMGELLHSEVRFRRLLEAGIVGIMEWSASGRIISANDTLLRMLGYSREDLAAGRLDFRALTPPEHQEATERAVRTLKETGVLQSFEKQYIHRDGHRVDILISSATLDETRERSIALILDISESKRAEAALRQREAELRTLAESMPQVVWTARPDGRLDYINQVLADYLDKSAEEVLSTPWPEFLHPDDRTLALERWARSVATGEPHEVEFRIRRVDGVYRWFLTRAHPMKDAAGRVVKWFGTSTDIEDKVRAQEDLRRRVEFERQLIGIVSHDLRNPLGAITLGATALLQRDDLDERQTKSVVRIQSSAERAIRLIRDLLDFTQVRMGGGIPVNRKPMDLHGFTRQVVDEVQLVHPERRIDVVAQGDGRGEWDPDRLAQVLTNLLSNALNYSPPDTPVTVRTLGTEGERVLEVHNWGAPIPSEKLPLLFEPLERGAAQQDRMGRSIGLGLFIIRHIVESHGGSITVRSEAEEGTTFTVHLPRQGAGKPT
jgi:PAS domain S-box-containing protein